MPFDPLNLPKSWHNLSARSTDGSCGHVQSGYGGSWPEIGSIMCAAWPCQAREHVEKPFQCTLMKEHVLLFLSNKNDRTGAIVICELDTVGSDHKWELLRNGSGVEYVEETISPASSRFWRKLRPGLLPITVSLSPNGQGTGNVTITARIVSHNIGETSDTVSKIKSRRQAPKIRQEDNPIYVQVTFST